MLIQQSWCKHTKNIIMLRKQTVRRPCWLVADADVNYYRNSSQQKGWQSKRDCRTGAQPDENCRRPVAVPWRPWPHVRRSAALHVASVAVDARFQLIDDVTFIEFTARNGRVIKHAAVESKNLRWCRDTSGVNNRYSLTNLISCCCCCCCCFGAIIDRQPLQHIWMALYRLGMTSYLQYFEASQMWQWTRG